VWPLSPHPIYILHYRCHRCVRFDHAKIASPATHLKAVFLPENPCFLWKNNWFQKRKGWMLNVGHVVLDIYKFLAPKDSLQQEFSTFLIVTNKKTSLHISFKWYMLILTFRLFSGCWWIHSLKTLWNWICFDYMGMTYMMTFPKTSPPLFLFMKWCCSGLNYMSRFYFLQ
jgi:hypothetical protein